jgi:hypothetical protein
MTSLLTVTPIRSAYGTVVRSGETRLFSNAQTLEDGRQMMPQDDSGRQNLERLDVGRGPGLITGAADDDRSASPA